MAACPGVVLEPYVWGGGGRTWQNYCRTLGLVEFRGAEGPASMRNHVTGGGGAEDGEWQEPPGVPQGVLLGPLEVTRPRPLKSHLILGSRALTHRAVINACLSLHPQAWPVRSVFKRQSRTNECMRNKM